MKLDILKQNLVGTNWNNLREENNKIIADHYGPLTYSIGNGRTNCYEGTTPCILYPSKKITDQVFDCGPDQSGFITQELDFVPLGERNNF